MEVSGAGSVLEIKKDPDADPGGPKTYGYGCGSGSPTLAGSDLRDGSGQTTGQGPHMEEENTG